MAEKLSERLAKLGYLIDADDEQSALQESVRIVRAVEDAPETKPYESDQEGGGLVADVPSRLKGKRVKLVEVSDGQN